MVCDEYTNTHIPCTRPLHCTGTPYTLKFGKTLMRHGLVLFFFLSMYNNHFSHFRITDWEVLITKTLIQWQQDTNKNEKYSNFK